MSDGFTLLAFGAEDGTVAPFETSARGRGVPLKIVRDAYAGELKDYGERLVLVRPDQYVAWTGGSDPVDADTVIRKVAGTAR